MSCPVWVQLTISLLFQTLFTLQLQLSHKLKCFSFHSFINFHPFSQWSLRYMYVQKLELDGNWRLSYFIQQPPVEDLTIDVFPINMHFQLLLHFPLWRILNVCSWHPNTVLTTITLLRIDRKYINCYSYISGGLETLQKYSNWFLNLTRVCIVKWKKVLCVLYQPFFWTDRFSSLKWGCF